MSNARLLARAASTPLPPAILNPGQAGESDMFEYDQVRVHNSTSYFPFFGCYWTNGRALSNGFWCMHTSYVQSDIVCGFRACAY